MKSAAVWRTGANFAGFQAVWFACIIGAGQGYPMLGPFAAALWLTLHLVSFVGADQDFRGRTANRAAELKLLAAAAMLGYGCDSVLVLGGALAFPDHAGPAAPTTPWMIALWMAFAATLRHSLDWARRRYALGAAAGAIFGPIAYTAGEALGGVALAAPPRGWLAVAAAWALAMPLLLWLRERFDPRADVATDGRGAPAAARSEG
ncbi:MAG: DUF2878 domain-containing protein [Thiotrichales bacterium]|nr:DUF2878 domain-containing protein [Thiotrichales bacterium]